MISVIPTILQGFYTLVFILAIPVILLSLLWKSRKNPAYRDRWLERFGIFKGQPQPGGIWLHAVSLGESIAAIPLIRALQKEFPQLSITMTSMTPTGSGKIQTTFGDRVFHVYFPYDLPWCWRQFLKRIKPKIVILMETEIWPNCLSICQHEKIPVMIVNARLSPRSMKGFSRIGLITRQMLEQVSLVAAQSKLDGDRYIELGLDPKRLQIAGNIKFDTQIKEDLETKAKQLKESFGLSRPVFIAASTHSGEEEQVLNAFLEIRQKFKDALLILVPRHPERFHSVSSLVKAAGLSFILRSSGQAPTQEMAVYLGDTLGELFLFYAASDVAFVGGSLIPVGGHNTLEPAAVGIPVIVGPHVHNFVDITKMLQEAGALVQVQDSVSLAKAVNHWFSNIDEGRRCGLAGKAVVEKNRGAVLRTVDIIKNLIAR